VIHLFGVLQFPLLALSGIVVALAIGGSDLEHPAGKVTVGALALLLVLDRPQLFLARRLARSPLAAALPLLAGAACAGALFAETLHDTWDEHDTPRALLAAGALLASQLASRLGAVRSVGAGGRGTAGALVLVAACWLPAWLLGPAGWLLGLAGALALAACTTGGVSEAADQGPRPAAGWRVYAAMLCVLELSQVIWDHNLMPDWTAHLTPAFLAAAAGAALAGRSLWRAEAAVLAAGAVAVVLGSTQPAWVPSLEHTLAVGAALGVLLRGLGPSRSAAAPLAGATLAITFGWVLGLALGLNLAYAPWRAALLVPLVLVLLRARARGRAARAATAA
jgi:hypothetical protein